MAILKKPSKVSEAASVEAPKKKRAASAPRKKSTQKLPEVVEEQIVAREHREGNGSRRKRSPAPEEIARRAYEIWEEHGCPSGQDEEHWHQAIRELSR